MHKWSQFDGTRAIPGRRGGRRVNRALMASPAREDSQRGSLASSILEFRDCLARVPLQPPRRRRRFTISSRVALRTIAYPRPEMLRKRRAVIGQRRPAVQKFIRVFLRRRRTRERRGISQTRVSIAGTDGTGPIVSPEIFTGTLDPAR